MQSTLGGKAIDSYAPAESAVDRPILFVPSVAAALTALDDSAHEAQGPTRFLFS
jgi:hypothetical protein